MPVHSSAFPKRHHRFVTVWLARRPHARVLLLAFLAATVLSGCVLSGLLQSGWAAAVSIAALLALAACSSSSGGGGGGGGGGGDDTPDEEPIVWPATVSIGDLTAETGFILLGELPSTSAGFAVSSGHDVTGDDIDDLLVGDPYVAGDDGAVFLILGDNEIGSSLFGDGEASTLTSLTSEQAIVFSGYYDDNAGSSVAIAPDVNGDDIGDILIGEPYLSPEEGSRGATWVIFGDASLSNRDLTFQTEADEELTAVEARWLRITETYAGEAFAYHRTGFSVAAGDINGDGLADIVTGSPESYNYGESAYTSARVSVVFGDDNISHTSGTVGLEDEALYDGTGINFGGLFDANANNPLYDSYFGKSVAVGDVDGDGKDDVIAGSNDGILGSEGGNYGYSGAVILFGADDLATTFPGDLDGSNGVRLLGGNPDAGGDRVAFLGDINGDGKGDVAVTDDSVGGTGRVYVVFGQERPFPGSVRMTDGNLDGTNGFVVDVPLDSFDPRIAGGADLNGDGIADFIVASNLEGGQLVAAHVIFGAEDIGSSGTIDLDDLELNGTDGFTIEFAESQDDNAASFTFGDLNGDGYDDIVMGATAMTTYANAGAVFVIFGLTRE